jgi:hypothetical protein
MPGTGDRLDRYPDTRGRMTPAAARSTSHQELGIPFENVWLGSRGSRHDRDSDTFDVGEHGQITDKSKKRQMAGALKFLKRLVAGACNARKPPSLPFRYRLPVKRRVPLILLPPSPTGGFEPPALGP